MIVFIEKAPELLYLLTNELWYMDSWNPGGGHTIVLFPEYCIVLVGSQ